jgi:hypothetical protein
MQTIVRGKDAVLEYLEDHALAATNKQPPLVTGGSVQKVKKPS